MVDPEAEHTHVAPAGTVIETKMAAREIELIVRGQFRLPESADERLAAMCEQIAVAMSKHFLATHKLYWGETHGSA